MKTEPISEHWVLVDGISTLYYEAGDGRVLLVVHGNVTTPRSWFRTMTDFMSTHRVLALSLPGYGGTSPVDDLRPARLASFIISFLDELSIDRAIVVGHSAGGLIAATLALEHPERVSRLVLVDAAGLGRTVHPLLIAIAMTPGWAATIIISALQLPGAGVVRALMTGLQFRRPWKVSPSGWLDHIRQTHVRTVLQTSYETVRLAIGPTGLRARYNLTDRLENLQVPTLVVWGLTDDIFPAWHGMRAARRLPHGRLVILKTAGHIGFVDNHTEFIDAIGPFIREVKEGEGGDQARQSERS
jgi:pimeloyl-ACP methyl ester carboxylesterase